MMGSTDALVKWESTNPLFPEFPYARAMLYSNIFGCIFGAICILSFLIVFCLRNMIKEAVGVIEAACECLFSMPSLLVWPLIEAIFKMCLVMALCTGLFFVLSMSS